MKLSEYPRPPADNGRGIHWSPSQYQWGRNDWLTWQKRILDMGLKWIKVNVPPDYNGEAIAKRLIDIEVMPVCRFILKNPSRIDGSIEKSIERLVNLGVRYFETNNEPDADIEWVSGRRQPGWEEVVVKNLIYDAARLHAIGAIPAFVAFNSGPDEPRNPIQILVEQPGGRELFEKGLWVSLHNYGKGRPFNYPNDRVRMFGDPVSDEEWLQQGQPDFWSEQDVIDFCWHGDSREDVNRWRQEQKDPNISIMTDITCFRAFEYWNQLITQEGLPSIPIMMTEGGWETGDRIDNFYPEPTAQYASDLNFAMFQFMQGDIDMTIYNPDETTKSYSVPDYFFSVMPWHMGEKAFGQDTSGQWEQGAWFSDWHNEKFGLKGELPIIQMLRDLPSKVRVDGPVPEEWNMRKGISPDIEDWDYILLYLRDGIEVEQVSGDGPQWKVVAGLWQDKEDVNPREALPPGYIMVKVLDENGDPIPDATFEVDRGDAVDKVQTKGDLDKFLGNYKMAASLGTYSLKVTHQGYPSDKVCNLGLGGENPGSDFDQTSFLFVFQLTGKASETADAPVSSETEATEATAPATNEAETSTAPVTLSNDASHVGVEVSPTTASPRCAVSKVHLYTPEERMPPSSLFLDVLNKEGERAFGSVVLVKDVNDTSLRVTIEKPQNEPGGNMPIWGNNVYRIEGVEVNGQQIASDSVTNIRSTVPNQGDGYSYLVVLQLP